jgi:tetraacyldisaccharide 4'-kinase
MRPPEFWLTGAGPWPRLLAPMAALNSALGRARRRLVHPATAGVPVICIGNLTAGGTGKTPTAIAIARLLAEKNLAVQFLTRGYGGRLTGPVSVDAGVHEAAEVGDESLLLAETAPCWVARDRVRGAAAAIAAGAQVLVLDDGFQNPALEHDLDIVVVDGATGFGNGRVIPAGPLREKIADGLARASAAVIMGADTAKNAAHIGALAPDLPLLTAHLAPTEGAEQLAGQKVFAFAGIGRPEKFFATIEEIGAELAGFRAFADHHPYDANEIMAICEAAQEAGAKPVTTAKDAVRLPAEARAMVEVVKVEAVFDNPAALNRLLEACCIE